MDKHLVNVSYRIIYVIALYDFICPILQRKFRFKLKS
jgi:hypothetical protein